MDANKLLSEIVAYRTYAKYLPHLQRRETFEETVNRCMNMHLERFPKLSADIVKAFGKVHNYHLMPAMRTLQFASDAIKKNNIRSYNCSFLPIDNVRAFGESLFLLLSGTGVGFSVQKHHTEQLPIVKVPKEEGVFVVHDSIEGWAQAVDMLMEAYLYRRIRPIYDFTFIRPKGAYLSTTGAKAPGQEPLRILLSKVEDQLKLAIGRKLRPIEVHDIICILSEGVLAGGVRRSSLISLFDRTDQEMLKSKSGEWWSTAPWRARANNSMVLPRWAVTQEEFYSLFKYTQESGAGEPGFFWTNDVDLNVGTNPCAEVSLNPFQFCNLSTVNQTGVTTKKEFLSRIHSATLIGTLQASYTDFPYVRDIWRETTEKEALVGVSFTGIADADTDIPKEWLEEGAKFVLELNEKYAKKIGINPAARTTLVKPEGTSSIILGSSSGVHARHAAYYIRRIRMSANDSLAVYLRHRVPELMEEDVSTSNTIIFSAPQKSPSHAVLRGQETAMELFKRTLKYNKHWIYQGHRYGENYHNVSVTISVKENEWDELKEALWNERKNYNAISLLPYDGGTYQQAPFEECDEEKYNKMEAYIEQQVIDLREVKEVEDFTDRMSIAACAGGACEIV